MTARVRVDPRWWNARTPHGSTNGEDVLAGVTIYPGLERRIVDSRPPDVTWDDNVPTDVGEPHFEEHTYHTLFTAWTEREYVQAQVIRRFYLWEGDPAVGFSIHVTVAPRRSRSWPA